MSCGCSNTTPITTTTNCGSCGYNCTNCTCSTNPIITPAVVCADPEPCSELFPLECVIYTGPDIKCSSQAGQLYPNILHHVVLQNASTTSRNFVTILNNINAQLCYLFSKDYISQFLTIIQNDPTLSALFCNIVSSCNCECDLTCGTVTRAIYMVKTAPIDDTIDVNFTQVIGGTIKTFMGSISGTTLTITTNPGSIVFAPGQKITGTNVALNTFIISGGGSSWTLSQPSNVSLQSLTVTHITYIVSIYQYINGNYYYLNEQSSGFLFPTDTTATASIDVINTANDNTSPWLVSVFANDEFADSECTSGYHDATSTIVIPVDYYDSCGFFQIPSTINLDCPYICIDRCTSQGVSNPPGDPCYAHWTKVGGVLEFNFTHDVTGQTNVYPVQRYTIHWYKRVSGTLPLNSIYEMVNGSTDIYDFQVSQAPYPTIQNIIVPTTIQVVSGVPEQWLLLITPKFGATNNADRCDGDFEVRNQPGAQYIGANDLQIECNWFIYNMF